MQQPGLPLQISPTPRRRGRPPGSRNKRSVDLARYVEATFGGMTPGQQAAELAMVKPADLKKARQLAADLGMIDLALPPLMLAMAVKARQLAAALGCTPFEAWAALHKERVELLAYIHQRRAPEADSKAKPPATVFLVPEGEAHQALADFSTDDEDSLEIAGEFSDAGDQVGRPKSDDDT